MTARASDKSRKVWQILSQQELVIKVARFGTSHDSWG